MKKLCWSLSLTCGALLAATVISGPARAAAPPGAPGSGLVTGGTSPSMDDIRAGLRLVIGADDATPAQTAALDLNQDGTLDVGDLVILIRAVLGLAALPQRPAHPASAPPPMAFETQAAWYDGNEVLFISTDDSDPTMAAQMKLNYTPALAAAATGMAVEPMYFFFTADAAGKLTPVPGQWPVFGTAPLETGYTPLWHVAQVIVSSSYKANTLTRDDDVTHDVGPANGGFVMKITPTPEVMNCPVLFRQAGGSPIEHPYVTPQATFTADATSVSLPTETVIYDGKTYLMVAPDSGDAQDAAAHHSNFAPALASADSIAIPFYVILGAAGPAQPPVLSAAPNPIGPMSTDMTYTPAWHSVVLQWKSSIANPPMLMSDDEVKSRIQSGDLTRMPGGFNFNCPVVALSRTAMPATGGPPPPATMTVAATNFTFQPQNITVHVGDTVVWTNQDSFAHTVTSGPAGKKDGAFDSSNLGAGKTFSFTFTKVGAFPYYCRYHFSMGMVGSVTVK